MVFLAFLCGRSWPMEIWTMSGWAMIGCPVWVCPSIEATSWSHWWMPACWTIWPRKSCVGSWKWWTVSTGVFSLPISICSLFLLFIILSLMPTNSFLGAGVCLRAFPNLMCLGSCNTLSGWNDLINLDSPVTSNDPCDLLTPQGEHALWNYVPEAPQLWPKGAGEEERWEPTPE